MLQLYPSIDKSYHIEVENIDDKTVQRSDYGSYGHVVIKQFPAVLKELRGKNHTNVVIKLYSKNDVLETVSF